jgi:hypothetical protein
MHVFDSSPQHLDHTYARSEEGGAENQFELHIIEDGYQSLPVPEQSYDLIMSEGLSFQFNTLKYVPSWIPYMKPGGAITITLPGVVKSQASDEVTHRLNAQRDEPIGTLEDYHEQIMALDGVKFVHQATLGQHSWDEYYQDLGRCLKSLIKLGELQPSDEVARAAQDELDWYRNYARGQVFL